MPNIARIRQLIADGKTDLEISAVLEADVANDSDFGWTSPTRTFHSLAATMHRASREGRGVPAHYVVVLLDLFRTIWEELAANGDAKGSEEVVLRMLAGVVPAETVSDAYIRLRDDMSRLALSVRRTRAEDLTARAAAEGRYHRQVGQHAVVCLAHVAAVIADVNKTLFSTFCDKPGFRELFTDATLQPCATLLLAYYPTWQELLAEPLAA